MNIRLSLATLCSESLSHCWLSTEVMFSLLVLKTSVSFLIPPQNCSASIPQQLYNYQTRPCKQSGTSTYISKYHSHPSKAAEPTSFEATKQMHHWHIQCPHLMPAAFPWQVSQGIFMEGPAFIWWPGVGCRRVTSLSPLRRPSGEWDKGYFDPPRWSRSRRAGGEHPGWGWASPSPGIRRYPSSPQWLHI